VTITAITPQVRRAGRFSVFIDGEFAFGVSEAQLAEFGLSNNQALTEQQLREFERRLDFDTVRRSAIRSLELRMNSESELRNKLKRKEFDPALIEDVLEWLKQRRLVDDAAFAARWIETRRELQGLGDYRLRQELRKKGIEGELIDEAFAGQGEEEEGQVGRAARWAARRYSSQLASLDDQHVKAKIMSAIVRRGFPYGIAKGAVEQLSAERDD
jgi:regulatory protein